MAKTKKKSAHYTDYEALTQREWMALGWLLFKTTEQLDWAFVCGRCDRSWTIREFKADGGDPNSAYQECINRREACQRKTPGLQGDACDWAAYGLFRGPWIVKAEDEEKPGGFREVPVFPFRGATKELAAQARAETDRLIAEAKAFQDREG